MEISGNKHIEIELLFDMILVLFTIIEKYYFSQ